MPLVDGSGNFGSLDGDPPAAMRYTECRLAAIAEALLGDIGQDTVPFRPNYDGTREEPVVLPAKLPNLLVNGATGIAVGMATNIPPHNPEEVCQAAIRLLDALHEGKQLSQPRALPHDQGPRLPDRRADRLQRRGDSGGLRDRPGQLKVRGTWHSGPSDRNKKTVFIDSIPYGVNKSALVERIAEVACPARCRCSST